VRIGGGWNDSGSRPVAVFIIISTVYMGFVTRGSVERDNQYGCHD
jgi:hypothetical protein